MKELTGIGIYTRNLLEELIPLDSSVEYVLFMNALKGPTPWNPVFDQNNASVIRRKIPGKLLLECWRRFQYPRIEKLARKANCTIFHSPNFIYQPSNIPYIVSTVHDLTFIKNKEYGSRYSGKYHRETLSKHIKRTSRIIVVSETVQDDLMNYFGVPKDKIRVIHHGLDRRYQPPDDSDSTQKRLIRNGYPEQYILSVGTLEPRKNFKMLINAFAKIAKKQPDIRLVIAGRFADEHKEVEKQINKLNLNDKIIMPGYVDSDILTYLYQGAQMAVFPSWEEGFGFPPLEAVACGIPVIASDISAHREVLGDSAIYFSHKDIDGLTHIMLNLMEDENYKVQNIQKGLKRASLFSWTKAAQKHLDVYKELIDDESPV